ncbi:BadF/BadG/BcrA/BcrD ATPase family protein [Hoeflea prorocentri]|uniref:N-acetylglucosamine kinase n=1 Tax=Hoeflea prorocentri TaxID=1922333 RepID=A0A9X3ZHY5_9HYPH|nr:BadF/BadG/BcrA/BcrD ATPase family protein [Hoeflea prorocentri]MCY6381301.1 N-acetylglucosamine kinase [Hoeflea prorocentri]MDA5399101.1 N-acetylglucosamine kinase [Hoeflea prorocentri]
MTAHVIGIDGGGTSCRAALTGRDGVVSGTGKSGAANILTDMNGGVRHIIEAAQRACDDAGLRGELSSMDVLLGLAGANMDASVEALRGRLPFRRCEIESDALIAVHGALGEADGVVAIIGTGAVFAAKQGSSVRTIGGWGFVVGDQGSGAALGQELMRRTLLAHDGVGPASDVTGRLFSEFGGEPQKVVAYAHGAPPGAFARYAPMVFEYAQRNDPVATAIIVEAAGQIDAFIDAMVGTELQRLCLLGGLAGPYEPWLADKHRARIVPAQGDALDGAAQLARQRFLMTGDVRV